MPSATVTSKGQITIPAAVRDDLGLRPGSRVAFVRLDDGSYELHAQRRTVTDLKGIVAPRDRPVTLEEMEAAVASGAASTATDEP